MAVKDYIQAQRQLLPPGEALENATEFKKTFDATAEEFDRIEQRAKKLLDEADPRTCYELLAEWEKVFGLLQDYAECGEDPSTLTIDERRKMLHAKWIETGGQSIEYIKQIILALGYEIELEEYKPFCAGSRVGERLYDATRWPFVFGVLAPSETVHRFCAGSCAGEPLASWGNVRLEWKINKIKPSHLLPIFKYGA